MWESECAREEAGSCCQDPLVLPCTPSPRSSCCCWMMDKPIENSIIMPFGNSILQGSGAVPQVEVYDPRECAINDVVSTVVTVSPGGKDRCRHGFFIHTTHEPLMKCSLCSLHLWSLLDRGISSQGRSSPSGRCDKCSIEWVVATGLLVSEGLSFMPLNQPSKKGLLSHLEWLFFIIKWNSGCYWTKGQKGDTWNPVNSLQHLLL